MMPAPKQLTTLIYCYDPMCSWCWGFKPVWQRLQEMLQPQITQGELIIEYRVGGLARDSDQPMPETMQNMLQDTWRNIRQQLGTEFNFDFWHDCQPRRSTYPACRACLVARKHGLEEKMIEQIQHAYYLNAQNPSNNSTLKQCAHNIGIEGDIFDASLKEIEANQTLEREIRGARQLGLNSFPSLALMKNEQVIHIALDYHDANVMAERIQQVLKG
ncbi:DsbA family protein [Bacterioplanoides sp. SCSIO 12839]|uniref:DsbA family protein n=1 Tax=Bacterioplanoides sp. SCSIO 12839 TaxID=2829569 RepID=UPI002102617D|nr:DsbA family protein [Bacterioplanoides sp. SCSIO 12839]